MTILIFTALSTALQIGFDEILPDVTETTTADMILYRQTDGGKVREIAEIIGISKITSGSHRPFELKEV